MPRYSRGAILAFLCSLPLLAYVAASAPAVSAGGACRGTPVTAEPGDEVEIDAHCFFPTVLYVTPGQTVTWTNREDVTHTVSGANLSWGDYTSLGRGQTLSHTFDEPGVYPYYCFAHPGMTGALVVQERTETARAGNAGDGDTNTAGLPRTGYAALGALGGIVTAGVGLAVVRRR